MDQDELLVEAGEAAAEALGIGRTRQTRMSCWPRGGQAAAEAPGTGRARRTRMSCWLRGGEAAEEALGTGRTWRTRMSCWSRGGKAAAEAPETGRARRDLDELLVEERGGGRRGAGDRSDLAGLDELLV